MKARTLKIAAIAASLVAAPMIGATADSPAAFGSCVNAYMAHLSVKKPNTLKLRDAHYFDERTDSLLPMSCEVSELALTARDANDHHALGHAVCTVNSDGTVIKLSETAPDYNG